MWSAFLYYAVKKRTAEMESEERSDGHEAEIAVKPPWGAAIIPLDGADGIRSRCRYCVDRSEVSEYFVNRLS